MRVILILIVLISVGLQSLIAWLWVETSAIADFESAFRSFYGHVPLWSSLAFGLGGIWFSVPAATVIGGSAVLVWQRRWPHGGKLAALSLGVTASMVYAMYPLHLMLVAI